MRRRLTQKRKKSNLVNSRRMRQSSRRLRPSSRRLRPSSRRSRPSISRTTSRRLRQKRNYTRRRGGAIFGGSFISNYFRKRNQTIVRQGTAKQIIKDQETYRKEQYQKILIATTANGSNGSNGCFEKWFLLTYWKDKITPKLSSELLSYCVHQKHACEGMRNVHWWNKTSRFYNNENRWFNKLKVMTDEEAATFLLLQIEKQVLNLSFDRRNFEIKAVPQAETFATVLQTIIERILQGICFTDSTCSREHGEFQQFEYPSKENVLNFPQINNTQLANILCCLFSKKIQKLDLLYRSNLKTVYAKLNLYFENANLTVSLCFLQKCKIMLLVCLLLLSADEIDVYNYIKVSQLKLPNCVEAIYILALHKDDKNQSSGDLMKMLENLRKVLNFSIESLNVLENKNLPEYPMFNVKPESKFDFARIAQKLSFSFAFAFDFDFSLRGPADLAFEDKLRVFDEIKKTDKHKFKEFQRFIHSVMVHISQSSENKKIYIMTNLPKEINPNPIQVYKEENKYPIGTILVKSNVHDEYNSLAVATQQETSTSFPTPLEINSLNKTFAGVNGMQYFAENNYHVKFQWLMYSPPPSLTQCQKNIIENASIYFVEYPKEDKANSYFKLLKDNKDNCNFVLLTEKKMSEINENDLPSVFKCKLTDGTTRTDVERALRKLQHVVDFLIQYLNLNDTEFYYTETFYTKIAAIKEHIHSKKLRHFLFDYKELTINLFKAVLPFIKCTLTTPETIDLDIKNEKPYEDMSDATIPANDSSRAPATLSSSQLAVPLAPTSNLPVTSNANVSEEHTYGEQPTAISSRNESLYASVNPDGSPRVHESGEIAAQRRLSTQSSYAEPNPTSAEERESNVVAEANTGAAPTTNIYGDFGYVNLLNQLFQSEEAQANLAAAKKAYFEKKCPNTFVGADNIEYTLNAWCIKHEIQQPERVLALLRHRCDFSKGDVPVLSSADYGQLLLIMKRLTNNQLTEEILNDILYINLTINNSNPFKTSKKLQDNQLAERFVADMLDVKQVSPRYVEGYLFEVKLKEDQFSFETELPYLILIYLILHPDKNDKLFKLINILASIFNLNCFDFNFYNFLVSEKTKVIGKSLSFLLVNGSHGLNKEPQIKYAEFILKRQLDKNCPINITTGGATKRQKPKHKKNNKKRKTRR